RSKRSPMNSGLHVPLIVRVPPPLRDLVPKDYAAGGSSEELVSFVDLAPTMLSLAGLKPPEWMQGRAFLGPNRQPEPPYLYGFRGRMDERYDLIRSVRDHRYVYVRNYLPHIPAGQHNAYMFETPTTRVWKKLFDEGKLNGAQRLFREPPQPEELVDLKKEKDQVHNLAGSAPHQDPLPRVRKAEQEWVQKVRDVGFLPEGEIHSRSKASTPYEMGHDNKQYPLE